MIFVKLAFVIATVILGVQTDDWPPAPPVDNSFAKILHQYEEPKFCLAKDPKKEDTANRFPVLRTSLVRTANGDFEPIDLGYVGRVPKPTISMSSFVMNSLLLPNRELRLRWWRNLADSRRSERAYHALVEWDAFNGFSGFVRTIHGLKLAMGCVGVTTEEMKTEVGAKVFANLWAPKPLGWDIIDVLQSKEDLHGAVVYYNAQSDTLAVAFRPFTDPDIIQSAKQGLLAADTDVKPVVLRGWDDESKHFSPIQVKGQHIQSPCDSDDDGSVCVISGAPTVYERTEKLVIERLNELAKQRKLPGKRLMLSGISAGGVFSEFFAIRLALNPPKFMRQKYFESKEVLTFNAPPGFSKIGASSVLENVLQDGGWSHRRVVGEDLHSIFWFGLVETRPLRNSYRQLGNAILVSRYPEQVGLKQYKGVFAIEIAEPDFPSELIPWTSIRTDTDAIRQKDMVSRHKLDMNALKLRIKKEWMGISNHVMGLGLSLLEIGEAVKDAGKCTSEIWSQLMWP